MYRSIIAQEKVVRHLKSLHYEGSTEQQIQENRDLLEDVIAARKDLVERMKYLEVAFDYDWDAAKVFREMREANPSSIVLKAVTESKKRKAAVKGKEGEEGSKKKRRNDGNNNSVYSWRSSNYQPQSTPQYWHPQQQQQQMQQPQHYGFQQPSFPPPAAPYARQAGPSFRPPRPPGCFNCGDSSHGYRRCPNTSGPPQSAPSKPQPPPST